MSAEQIKGMPIANKIRDEIVAEVEQMKSQGGPLPNWPFVLVGDDEASVVYARSKEKVGDKLGIIVELTVKPSTTSEADVLSLLDKLNADESVHGILWNAPAKGIQQEKVSSRLDPLKDVDGVHPVNRGYLLGGQEHLALVPATPMACIELMERAGVVLRGKRVALVGPGDTRGRPLASCSSSGTPPSHRLPHQDRDIPSITKAAGSRGRGRRQGRTGHRRYAVPAARSWLDAGINAKEEGGITATWDFDSAVEVSRPLPRFRAAWAP
jgi:methylenetetrahydrofolate dehydrogenase (NADP+)/methenyltetrahydrofolate cyclohydrolase